MSNLNKWYKTEKEQTDLRVISFVSRPKDNIEVEDFSSRKTSFISTMTDEELVPIFEAWAKQGKKNEFSRMYTSLNKRNHKTVQLSLMHYLLDNQDLNLGSLDSRIAMIAAQPEHALESKYFYDFDADAEQLKEFLSDLATAYEETKKLNKKLTGEFKFSVRTTPNYYAVILEERFKTSEVEEKWKELVTLKKDALYCAAWYSND
jgi:hypothetical protein